MFKYTVYKYIRLAVTKWTVEMTAKAEKELFHFLKQGRITREDARVIRRWVREMENYGPNFIKRSPEWHDHALEREWFGFRSSAFSSSGRIIYRIIEDKILVQIRKVTPDHNYKK